MTTAMTAGLCAECMRRLQVGQNRLWQSYLENKTSDAMRMYWVYEAEQKDITVIGLEPHPEDKKNGAYDRVTLSELDNN